MATRIVKIALLLATSLFFLIVVLNNAVFDYPSNYGFVQHVLSMDTLFSGDAQAWRAFRDPTPADGSYWLHHAFYWTIIAWEAATGLLCAAGAWRMTKSLKSEPAVFAKAKSLAIYGLGLSLLQWFTAFITVGAEWFLMWQSKSWNGQDAAFRMFTCLGIVLLVLLTKEEAVEE